MRFANVMKVVCATVVVVSVAATPAAGQFYSIDFQGPTAGSATPGAGLPDAYFGAPISEGDLLDSAGFWGGGAPGIVISAVAGGPGQVPGGLGIVPGPQGFVEVDALSAGGDMPTEFFFSVDEFAEGTRGDLLTYGALGAQEAPADLFEGWGQSPAAPTSPPWLVNRSYDGLTWGLVEPDPPTSGALPDAGDNIDAVGSLHGGGRTYFSLDAGFADPLEPSPPVNSGTAAANGFSGADILVSTPGGTPSVWMPATALGLDLAGPDTDDLDALILHADWGTFLFSVRRGSAVIGQLDSRFNIPIEPGDILEPPLAPGQTPAIVVAAEVLGLATVRSGSPNQWGFGDDLDALGWIPEPATMGLMGLGGLMVLRRGRACRRGQLQ